MLRTSTLGGLLAMSLLFVVGQISLFANDGLLLAQRGLYNVDDSQSKDRKQCPYCGGDHEGYACPHRPHPPLFLHFYVYPSRQHTSPHYGIPNTTQARELPAPGPLVTESRHYGISNTTHVTSTSRPNAATGTGASKAIGAGAAGAAAAGAAVLFRRKKNDNGAQA